MLKSPSHYLSRLSEEFEHIRGEFGRLRGESDRARAWQRMHLAVARGSAGAALRRLDPVDPRTWEFSGFSQNGEDGIIDYLLSQLTAPNRYFVEIGASNGLENNTSWLAIVRRYGGLMVEGDGALSQQCRQNFATLNWGLRIEAMRVTPGTAAELGGWLLHQNPDLFSLDIDGIDLYVMERFLELGVKPKLVVVEYNSALGPDASVTVSYKEDFDIAKESASRLYYGVSVRAWRRLLTRAGYEFVCVDQNGVNAFFVDPQAFPAGFARGIRGLEFQENFAQLNHHRTDWRGQYETIKHCSFRQVD